MSLTYDTYKSSVADLLVIDPANASFLMQLPNMIDYAEGRMYRELDLISTRVRDTSVPLTTATRAYTPPTGFVVIEGINVVTPFGTAIESGVRNPLLPVSRDWLDLVYPDPSNVAFQGVPQFFSIITQSLVLVGPAPDQAYGVEVIGTKRPLALSASTTTTFLSTYLPDLLIAASMVWGAGYQKNFGAQVDDPQMAGSWENQYKTLFSSANAEELRKKFMASAWSSLQAPPGATPPRN